MKRYILTLMVGLLFFSTVSAEIVCPQRLTPDQFNNRQQEFIVEEAGLTEAEANEFFVIFFELQQKKRENNHKVWELMRDLKEGATDKEYDKTLLNIYKLRALNNELDIDYYSKYKKVISSEKIFKVLNAESKFQREIIRGMHQHNQGGKGRGPRRAGRK